MKKIFLVLFVLCVNLFYAQKKDLLLGEFTYILRHYPDRENKKNVMEEPFVLKVTDKQAYFSSKNKMIFDSIFNSQFDKRSGEIDMRGFNKHISNFIIVQNSQEIKYYETIGKIKMFYSSPIVSEWKLLNETQVINSIECKKAEVTHKGRHWTAWYSTEISFPYGPHRFGGLPGLIIKMYDDTGDYEFELVQSISTEKLKDKIAENYLQSYENAKQVTRKELHSVRESYRTSLLQELQQQGTIFLNETNESLRQRQKANAKKANPIELED